MNKTEKEKILKRIEEKYKNESPKWDKIIDFIDSFSFIDSKEIYTNGRSLVQPYRVYDALIMNGGEYAKNE